MSLVLAVPLAREEIGKGSQTFKGRRRPLTSKPIFVNKEIYLIHTIVNIIDVFKVSHQSPSRILHRYKS